MKHVTRRADALAAFVAVLLACFAAWIAYAQTSGPQIVLGLADPASFSKILPLPDPVSPRAPGTRGAGMIIFRAQITGTNLMTETISVPKSSCVCQHSPTNKTFIGIALDTRPTDIKDGMQIPITVIAIDAAKRKTTYTRTVTLKK